MVLEAVVVIMEEGVALAPQVEAPATATILPARMHPVS